MSLETPEKALKLVDSSWHEIFKQEYKKDYFIKLLKFIQEVKKSKEVYPSDDLVFRWTKLTKFDNLKVVILGQDPYHGKGEANGLAFSVNKGTKVPPSLDIIFKELSDDADIKNFKKPNHGDLTNWAEQGVLLLNAVLTVNQDDSNSHKDKGWEKFTDAIMNYIIDLKENIVFMLWGKHAQNKSKFYGYKDKHLFIECVHPSPLSSVSGGKFVGSKCFSKTNAYLQSKSITPINWGNL